MHLADWPDADAAAGRRRLVGRWTACATCAPAALRCARRSRLRVRLPLQDADGRPSGCAILEAFRDIIADEINVKAVTLTREVGAVRHRATSRSIRSSARRSARKVKEVFVAANVARMEDARRRPCRDRRRRARSRRLRAAPADARTASSRSRSIAGAGSWCSTSTVYHELQAEGWARDFVRLVQNARKQAGLQVTDRIRLAATAEGPIGAALQTHATTISDETLAVAFDVGANGAAPSGNGLSRRRGCPRWPQGAPHAGAGSSGVGELYGRLMEARPGRVWPRPFRLQRRRSPSPVGERAR